MPENLSSVMDGGATAANLPEKKKLKKVGDYWVDEQGNKFSDEAGTQPVKSEGEQAAGGTGSTLAQSATSFMDQIQENPGQNVGSVLTGQVGKKPMEASPYATETKNERRDSDAVFEANKDYLKDKLQVNNADEWYDRWQKFSPAFKKKWLKQAESA